MAALRTSTVVMSAPETVATTGVLLVVPGPWPENAGTRYHAIAMQMTMRIAVKAYFLNAADSCINRIIVFGTPEVSGKIDYKAGAEMLLGTVVRPIRLCGTRCPHGDGRPQPSCGAELRRRMTLPDVGRIGHDHCASHARDACAAPTQRRRHVMGKPGTASAGRGTSTDRVPKSLP